MNRSHQLLSVQQASERLGISIFTLRTWVSQHKVPYVKLGKRVLFDSEDLLAFIREQKVAARPRRGNGDQP